MKTLNVVATAILLTLVSIHVSAQQTEPEVTPSPRIEPTDSRPDNDTRVRHNQKEIRPESDEFHLKMEELQSELEDALRIEMEALQHEMEIIQPDFEEELRFHLKAMPPELDDFHLELDDIRPEIEADPYPNSDYLRWEMEVIEPDLDALHIDLDALGIDLDALHMDMDDLRWEIEALRPDFENELMFEMEEHQRHLKDFKPDHDDLDPHFDLDLYDLDIDPKDINS